MAPIYNPPASASATDADEQYFTDLGLLTGLTKLVGATGGNTFPTPDDSYPSGTAVVITNNMMKWGAASAESWEGYNIGTMSTVLVYGFNTPSTAQTAYILVSADVLDTSNLYVGQDIYIAGNEPAAPAYRSQITRRVGGTFTELGADSTIFGDSLASSHGFGWALYVTDSVQKYFLKFGSTSEWLPIFSETDGSTTSFKSVAFQTLAKNQRATTPFAIWGA